jgi:hypothetical protein
LLLYTLQYFVLCFLRVVTPRFNDSFNIIGSVQISKWFILQFYHYGNTSSASRLCLAFSTFPSLNISIYKYINEPMGSGNYILLFLRIPDDSQSSRTQ